MLLSTAIGIGVAVVILTAYFLDTQDKRLEGLTRHDEKLKAIREYERNLADGLQNTFEIFTDHKADRSYDIDAAVKILQFRYSHLHTLAKIEELPKEYKSRFRNSEVMKVGFEKIMKDYERHNQLVEDYTNEYGEIGRSVRQHLEE